MATKISFLNLKGGVGKTSIIVNVAACMAYAGKKVLVVDLDAQSNSSIWLMRLDRWNELNRTPEKFLTHYFADLDTTLKSLIQPSPVRLPTGEAALPTLDLIPAAFSLMDLEHEIVNPDGRPFYCRFREEIQSLENQYDYILFDCPPNFLHAPKAALFTSDHIVVPSNPDALSIIGFHLLVDKCSRFELESERHTQEMDAPRAQILGVVLNAIKQGANIDVPLERFQAQIDRFKEQGKVAKQAIIFPEQIRHSVTVGRAVMQGLPMVLLTKKEGSQTVAEDYIHVAKRILSSTTSTGSSANTAPAEEAVAEGKAT